MRILLALFLTLALAMPALAAFEGPGTPTGATTVAQALKASDDTPCTLEGNIVQKVTGDDDNYIFRDGTGQIVVDIDHKVFMDRKVTPDTKVRLSGKVDAKRMRDNEVDVKRMDIL